MLRGSDFISMNSMRSDGIISYAKFVGERRPRNKTTFDKYDKYAKYTGVMSGTARKNIQKAIDILLQISPEIMLYNPVSCSYHQFKINFITLTISDAKNTTHHDAYSKCLAPFLRWIRSKGATAYIWKAELQHRGQIHYHITTNKFIHYKEIRLIWNKFQKRAGYLEVYGLKFKHFNPNSTDVHSVTKIRNIKNYLGKYLSKEVSKNEAIKNIKGKVWDCSKNLKVGYYEKELDIDSSNKMYLATQKLKDVYKSDFFTYYKNLRPESLGYGFSSGYQVWKNSITTL